MFEAVRQTPFSVMPTQSPAAGMGIVASGSAAGSVSPPFASSFIDVKTSPLAVLSVLVASTDRDPPGKNFGMTLGPSASAPPLATQSWPVVRLPMTVLSR